MKALSLHITHAADRTFKIGEEILVYRKHKKQWIGPMIDVNGTGKIFTAYNQETKLRHKYISFQVKP